MQRVDRSNMFLNDSREIEDNFDDGEQDTSQNAWQKMQNLIGKDRMERLEEESQNNGESSRIEEEESRNSGFGERYF